jgi:hypothetical protein
MTLTYRRPMTSLRVAAAALALLLVSGAARSRAWADEEDDIQRQIDVQKSGVADLEHLDRQHAATSEIQRLRDWLGQAWDLRNKHEPDDAREVLERCVAQAELVRQVITAAQLKTQVADREAKLAATKSETEKKKKALLDAQVRKRALEQPGGAK